MPIDPAILYINNIINNPKKWTVGQNTGEQLVTNSTTSTNIQPVLTIAKITASNEKISQFPRNDSKTYSNIRWSSRVGRTTENDTTNPNLLNDINEAAKQAGVIVTITTAKEGHAQLTSTGHESRHYVDLAVDIAIVNGRSVKGNHTDADKFVLVLESMGYNRNIESGKSKAVLWLTGGHYDHVHVSNKIR